MLRRALVALLAPILVAIAACSDDDERAQQARDVADRAGLPADVQELLGRAAGAQDETFHIEYDVTAADGSVQHVRVFQRPPDRRIDVIAPDGSEERTIVRDGDSFQCTRRDDDWTCAPLPDGANDVAIGSFDPDALDRTAEALEESRDEYAYEVQERTVAGVEASCLITRRIDAPEGVSDATLCVSVQGALLSVERPTERLDATAYGTDVADDAFELPAPATEEPQVP